jgi:hypothetical protein
VTHRAWRGGTRIATQDTKPGFACRKPAACLCPQVLIAGLKELKELKQLTTLDLSVTKVTEAGAKDLRTVLPKCEITR